MSSDANRSFVENLKWGGSRHKVDVKIRNYLRIGAAPRMVKRSGQFDRCVIVDGRAYGDAKFYGEWLLAAANAQSLWEQALEDKEFKKQVERLCVICLHDFGISANWLLMKLHEDITRFVFPVDRDEEGEAFAIMVGMGFFARKHHLYEMTLPSDLTVEKVRAAALEFAKTEDTDHVLHVEHLVTTMPYVEAIALHNRLRAGERIGRHTP